jgi:hypothetical protein
VYLELVLPVFLGRTLIKKRQSKDKSQVENIPKEKVL